MTRGRSYLFSGARRLRRLFGINPGFPGLSRCQGQITHVLLTRSPLSPIPKERFSLDLHVLSAPPAFVLSQDQTLREVGLPDEPADFASSLCSKCLPRSEERVDGSCIPSRAEARERSRRKRTLLSFQRPRCWREGVKKASPTRWRPRRSLTFDFRLGWLGWVLLVGGLLHAALSGSRRMVAEVRRLSNGRSGACLPGEPHH